MKEERLPSSSTESSIRGGTTLSTNCGHGFGETSSTSGNYLGSTDITKTQQNRIMRPLYTSKDVLKTLNEVNSLMRRSQLSTTGEEDGNKTKKVIDDIQDQNSQGSSHEMSTFLTSNKISSSRASTTTASLLVLHLAVAVRDTNHIQELVDEFYRYSQLKPGIISISRIERPDSQHSLIQTQTFDENNRHRSRNESRTKFPVMNDEESKEMVEILAHFDAEDTQKWLDY